MQVNLEEIQLRQAKLNEASVYLKQQFIGIDAIIDQLIEYMQIWYLGPELLVRPIIINLWGMTGVGKTDLIRKLVKFINFQDRFAEVELSNIDSTSYVTSVADVLDRQELNDGKPAIILFDEIQRFNTLDANGNAMPQSKFTDFWELLSDGKLAKKSKDDLDYYMMNYQLGARDIQKRKSKGEADVDENPFVDQWDARALKKALRLDDGIADLTNMTQRDMLDLISKEKRKKVIYEPVSHQQSLVIISGNLDEAFAMAGQGSETDVDADIFHAYTKKITDVDIKNALGKKFRPEQVARFGNIHLIYTSLKKADFAKLIRRDIERIIKRSQDKFDIQLVIDDSIDALIYRNGVFPVQGVRPVFSTVTDVLETHLSKLVFQALIQGHKEIDIKYDKDQSQIVARVGSEHVTIPYAGRIDKIRCSNLENSVANISVHECGHAVAYMVIFGLVPLQLKSKIASSYAGGFTFPHEIHMTRQSLIDMIKIYLAGGIAEELMFGVALSSTGRENDRERATRHAIDFVRRFAFDDEFKADYTLSDGYAMNKAETDTDIEKMLTRLEADTKELLGAHKALLLDLSLQLTDAGEMDVTAIQKIATKHGLDARIEAEGYLHIAPYAAQLAPANKLKPVTI
jgi:Peptidase family M41/ATPase family associated with various cellular activities (AAA)/C-terminal, D2-small domain, of ClpB protein